MSTIALNMGVHYGTKCNVQTNCNGALKKLLKVKLVSAAQYSGASYKIEVTIKECTEIRLGCTYTTRLHLKLMVSFDVHYGTKCNARLSRACTYSTQMVTATSYTKGV